MKSVLFLIVLPIFLAVPLFLSEIPFEIEKEVLPVPLSFSVYPPIPIQGDPLMIVFEGASLGEIKAATLGSTTLSLFPYSGKTAALYGFDLNQKPGSYLISLETADGRKISDTLYLSARERKEEPLGITEKLGGNTAKSQAQLVASLADENASLADVETEIRALWSKPFIAPLASTSVTDTYGYVRLTGAYSIPHKGADFRADIGTPVMAVNDGIVRISREYRVYGKTVVIDHGLGLQTLYMHLSKIDVSPGENVAQGDVIGLSGSTGYAERPHLHVSIRIGGVSIDPIVFLGLFGIYVNM